LSEECSRLSLFVSYVKNPSWSLPSNNELTDFVTIMGSSQYRRAP